MDSTNITTDGQAPGFAGVPRSVISLGPDIGSYAIHVFVVLADHANDAYECWPSISRISKLTGMTQQSVRNQLRMLKNFGIISIEHRGKKPPSLTNMYRFLPPHLPPKRNDSPPSTKKEGGTQRNDSPPLNETIDKQEPIEQELVEQEKKAASAAEIPEILESKKFRTAWDDYLTHRKEKRATMTPTAITRALVKLERWGHDRAVVALEHSTANGYTGVFEPSTNGNGKPKQPREEIIYRDITR